jgi:hypothetical protein
MGNGRQRQLWLPAATMDRIPHLFNERHHHIEPVCRREPIREAECQLSTPRTTVR